MLEVKRLIASLGIKLQRINTGCFSVGYGRQRRFIKTADRGTLDFEGYDKHGRFVALECKREKGGRLSAEQAERIRDINAKGGVAGVVKSAGEAYNFLLENDCI